MNISSKPSINSIDSKVSDILATIERLSVNSNDKEIIANTKLLFNYISKDSIDEIPSKEIRSRIISLIAAVSITNRYILTVLINYIPTIKHLEEFLVIIPQMYHTANVTIMNELANNLLLESEKDIRLLPSVIVTLLELRLSPLVRDRIVRMMDNIEISNSNVDNMYIIMTKLLSGQELYNGLIGWVKQVIESLLYVVVIMLFITVLTFIISLILLMYSNANLYWL